MRKFKIIVDALCDLPVTSKLSNNIEVLPYIFNIDNIEYLSTDLKYEDIYEKIKNNEILTSRPCLGVWKNIIQNITDKDMDILYIASTSNMTGALNSVKVIKNMLNTDCRIECVDTKLTTSMVGIIINEIIEYTDIDEAISKTQELTSKVNGFYSLDSTEVFTHQHRFDKIVKDFPIITMKDGVIDITDTSFDKKSSIDKVISKYKALKIINSYICVTQDTDAEYINYLKKETGISKLIIIGNTMNTYVGTNVIGIAFIEE